jgi:hypothetical protein
MRVLARLLGSLRRCLDGFPDKRRGTNTTYRMADFGMAAFSAFFMQSPSFLDHQRRLENGHARSNCQTLFDIPKIPTDNQIRDMLDAAEPELLYPVFAEPVAILEGVNGGLDKFQRLGGHVLIALDGTEYFSSKKIHCHNCSTRQRGKGETEYFHATLGATLVAPGHDKVIPLEPEFIAPQDGAEKQDCENAAAKRWLAAHGAQYARLNPIYLGDDLFSRQPLCEAVRAVNGHFIFVCKPSSHPLIQEYIAGGDLQTHEVTVKRGKNKILHRYRWIHKVPLRDGKDAREVNWFEIEIVNPHGEVTYRNSFITDLAIGANNVAELAACGRARWKIENESFNVLKTKGYNLEHNFGHGKENLAAVLVTLNLLAFAFHTVVELTEELWRRALDIRGTRVGFFSKLREITALVIFPSWRTLFETLTFKISLVLPP